MDTYLNTDIDKDKRIKNDNIKEISKERWLYEIYKRILDILTSSVGLIIGIPIITIVAIIIKIEDKGPIFYSQQRLGKDGTIFKIYKIRSMKVDAEKINGIQWAEKNDNRITKVGTFIRKTRIDEIPQLFNIIRGDMSLIGPRPERPELTYKFNEYIPGFTDRLIVKPGLTGLAQVNGGYDISPKEKLKWDMKYIEDRSILLDFNILIKTVLVVFTGEGAR